MGKPTFRIEAVRVLLANRDTDFDRLPEDASTL